MHEATKTFLRLVLPPNPLWSVRRLFWFWRDYRVYTRLSGTRLPYRHLSPSLNDRASTTPVGYYFYQDTWAFHKIVAAEPARHVDVGSTALLVGCLAGILPTISVDIRPLPVKLAGLTPMAGSVLDLPFASDSVESISSLCVIEHIGLGRYGDPVDPEGSVKSARELARVLQPGGSLYVSVPIGESQVAFNAHRIFSKEQVLGMFSGLKLVENLLVCGRGAIASPAAATPSDFCVGLFHFSK